MIASQSSSPAALDPSVALNPPMSASGSPTLTMTAKGLAGLQRDLNRLRSERDQDVRQRLQAARASGEATRNDEYWAVKEDEAVLSARIANLEDLLRRATVVDSAVDGHDIVRIGSTVSVEFLASGSTASYRITGAHEPREPGAASTASPIGQALLGQTPGAVVRFELPSGHLQHLRVLATRASAGTL